MRVRLVIGIGVGLALILPSLAQNSGLFSALGKRSAPETTSAVVAQVNVVAPPTTRSPSDGMPSRGMSMQQVENTFGAPVDRRTPVGDPPIARWEYQTFVVYFEYRHVIHAVPKR